MTRWNVELKYQTSVDADNQEEAYERAREEMKLDMSRVFASHCRKVKK